MSNFFDKEKYVLNYENLQVDFRLRLKLKSIIKHIVKTIYWIRHTKKNRSRKIGDKDGKALHKFMNNAIYGKGMEKLRKKINVKLVNHEKDSLTYIWKPSFMSHKVLNNNLVAIRKSEVALKFNRPVYIGMCILELNKVLTYKFHYDYVRNKYGDKSKLLFRDTDSLMYEVKAEDFYGDFSGDKEMFDFSNLLTKPKHYDNSNKLVIKKMKNETGSVVNEEFVGLKPRCIHFWENSKHKKVKDVDRNVAATIYIKINIKAFCWIINV